MAKCYKVLLQSEGEIERIRKMTNKMAESANYENMLSAMQSKNINVYEKEIWNAAIETAAHWIEIANRNGADNAKEIRKLKK